MRYLPIDQISENSILAMPIYSDSGGILLSANTALRSTYLKKLAGLGYAGLYIYDEISEHIDVHDLLTEKLRRKALKALKKMNLDACRAIAHSIVEELMSHSRISVDMLNVASFDNYTFTHSINVAVLCVTVGIGAGLNYEQLQRLSESALLHDIGKLAISVDILNKPGALSEEEMEVVRQHPEEGYKMLKSDVAIPVTVKESVYAHHENEDGSGYPRQLDSKRIPTFAKIIHVCDVYDALITARPYKKALNPADALEFLMSNCWSKFDATYVKKLMEYIAPYPTGITVELSDGTRALVLRQNSVNYMRPGVIRVDTREEIDLMNTLNLTITGILT